MNLYIAIEQINDRSANIDKLWLKGSGLSVFAVDFLIQVYCIHFPLNDISDEISLLYKAESLSNLLKL